ncbi:unnamed protein product [Mycena citricolor]|uniref:Uncharacterized protein n=1 Tax=Mycena citricolor TaxID=2018698 RepID=A0AAD2HU55_9AGAR|nr:unnamed protein product [Mycena citricolor]
MDLGAGAGILPAFGLFALSSSAFAANASARVFDLRTRSDETAIASRPDNTGMDTLCTASTSLSITS